MFTALEAEISYRQDQLQRAAGGPKQHPVRRRRWLSLFAPAQRPAQPRRTDSVARSRRARVAPSA